MQSFLKLFNRACGTLYCANNHRRNGFLRKNEFLTTHLSGKECKSERGGKTKQRIENARKELTKIDAEKLFLAALSAPFCFFERYSLCSESKSVQCQKVTASRHRTLTKHDAFKKASAPWLRNAMDCPEFRPWTPRTCSLGLSHR